MHVHYDTSSASGSYHYLSSLEVGGMGIDPYRCCGCSVEPYLEPCLAYTCCSEAPLWFWTGFVHCPPERPDGHQGEQMAPWVITAVWAPVSTAAHEELEGLWDEIGTAASGTLAFTRSRLCPLQCMPSPPTWHSR